MAELKAILLITAFVALTLLLGFVLLFVVVKIIMADEINSNDFLSDFYDREENENSDEKRVGY